MSKVVQGVAEIGGAIAIGVTAAALASTGAGFAAMPFLLKASIALGTMGIGAEIGAIADALGSNRGSGITTRQPAQFRQIVYGTRRIGGNIVYESSTGSKNDQYNQIIALTGHEVYAIQNLYLNGDQVFWAGAGNTGYTVRNGIGFGGGADGHDHKGPNGVTYNFANGYSGHAGVYCEARFGDQADGDYMHSLQANDSVWGPKDGQTPSLMGCAYLYLKLEDGDPAFTTFPPEVRITVQGKPVYDPRTGQTTYSSNPALIIADILSDTRYGLGDSSINLDQLIAAANLCDEQVQCAAGMEARYSCHIVSDTSEGVGDLLQKALDSCAGRLCRINGEWFIFPGAYIAPTLSFTETDLMGPVHWDSDRPYRERFNRVRGKYTAAQYPYNVAGNLYDSNGFYNGEIQNNFPFEFQPDDYPEFACDSLHGYASDEYLNQDGHELVGQLDVSASVLSVSQAQRLAKIHLMRSRKQAGNGKLVMSLAALQLQPCDTFTITFPAYGWVNKVMEVTAVELSQEQTNEGVPVFVVQVGIQEADKSVYAWDPSTEEKTPYLTPAIPTQTPTIVAPPTEMTVTSEPVISGDGSTVTHNLLVGWDTPADNRVTSVQVQYQVVGAAQWTNWSTVSVTANNAVISNVAGGTSYNVQIASLRATGATSVWVEASNIDTSNTVSPIVYQGSPVGQKNVTVSGTTATVTPINTAIAGTAVTYSGGSVAVTSGQTNYVYAYDPGLAAGGAATGGNAQPVATTNAGEYYGRPGYVLVAELNNAN